VSQTVGLCSSRNGWLARTRTLQGLVLARDVLSQTHEPALSIREVARAAELSPFHFIRLFEAVFGRTPHDYRIHARLEEAKRLLARGDSVTEACFAVGASSLGSFSAAFTRRVGQTPSAFRRRVRADAVVPGQPPPVMTAGCLNLMAFVPPGALTPQFPRSAKRPTMADSGA
jgi:AraC-like DNA-binding protein